MGHDIFTDLLSLVALFSAIACSLHFYVRFREVAKASVKDDMESLEIVHRLRSDGRISDDEFASLRAKLIGKITRKI